MIRRKPTPWLLAAMAFAALGGPGSVPIGRASWAGASQETDDPAEMERRLRENQARMRSFLPPKPPPPDEPPPEDGGPAAYFYTTDQAIQMLQERVREQPADFTSYSHLGVMYDRKARETGDSSYFEQAEIALRRALVLLPDYPRAKAALAMVLCARHKFAEALVLAEQITRQDPRDLDAQAIRGDALLSLGRYEEAEEAYAQLARLSDLPEVRARLANLAESRGRIDDAIRLMRSAAEEARSRPMPHAEAWFVARLGDLSFAAGRLSDAATYYEAVPEGVDAFHDATAGLARVRAAQGKIDEAIALYEKAVAIGPDPHMVTGLAELYRLTERGAKANALIRDLETALKPRPDERRHLALLYCDEGRNLPEALELARLDFEARQDVDAYATLAWALHKNGRHAEAAESIDRALAVGTRDALLHYRAALIFEAAGQPDRARDLLREALSINPHFSPTLADDARDRLSSLGNPQ